MGKFIPNTNDFVPRLGLGLGLTLTLTIEVYQCVKFGPNRPKTVGGESKSRKLDGWIYGQFNPVRPL